VSRPSVMGFGATMVVVVLVVLVVVVVRVTVR